MAAKLRDAGTRLWLDHRATWTKPPSSGTRPSTRWTTNNTLLNKEIQKGIYGPISSPRLRASSSTPRPRSSAVRSDPRKSFFILKLSSTGLASSSISFNAFVSVELHTDLSNDVERTVRLRQNATSRVYPEKFYVKVPLTPAGYLGARRSRPRPASRSNFTLGFLPRAIITSPRLLDQAHVSSTSFLGRPEFPSSADRQARRWPTNVRRERPHSRTQRELPPASAKPAKQKTNLIGRPAFAPATRSAPSPAVDVFHHAAEKAAAEYHAKTARAGHFASCEGSAGAARPTAWDARAISLATRFGMCPPQFPGRRRRPAPQETSTRSRPTTLQTHFGKKAGLGGFPAPTGPLGRYPNRDKRTAKISRLCDLEGPLGIRAKFGLDALMNL